MNELQNIPFKSLRSVVVKDWLDEWFALVSGTMDKFNAMTVAWGSFGGMWGKPMVQIVVRPQRYTYEFLEKWPTWTLNAFSANNKNDLLTLGSQSGRDGDKLPETLLTPSKSQVVEAPCFQEAELILECKTIYKQDMDPNGFLDDSILTEYPNKDYHRIYFGEILAIRGTSKYLGE